METTTNNQSHNNKRNSIAKQKLIIDVDTGVDDAQALMMALAASDHVDILAITCVAGNTHLDQVCYNTMRLLKVCKRTDVPLHPGASTALMAVTAEHDDPYHGSDGMGGVIDNDPPDLSLVREQHAVSAISRLAKQHKGEITLVCLAPLTNIALALKMDPELGANLKNVVIMGGNIEAKGNITLTGEFNFYQDPEAAVIALQNLKCPTQLLCWEPCLRNGIEWEWYDSQLSTVNTPVGRFHTAINEYSIRREREIINRPQYYSCDAMAMAIAINPAIVLESQNLYCSVSLRDELTRGQMVVDWRGQLGRKPNAEVVTKVNIEEIKKMFVHMVQGA